MLTIRWHSGAIAVCRLDPSAPVPMWAALDHPTSSTGCAICAVIRTTDQLTIVTAASSVPAEVAAERDFVACHVAGKLDFALLGVLKRLSGALADAGIAVLAISTYDTDWLLVRRSDAERATAALGTIALIENALPSE